MQAYDSHIEKTKQGTVSVIFYLVTGRSSKLPLKPLLQSAAGDSFLKAQTLFYGTVGAQSGS